MKVGVAGPVHVAGLLDLVDDASPADAELRGISGSTPVTQLVRAYHATGTQVSVATCDPAVQTPRLLTGTDIEIHVVPYRSRGRARDAFRAERRYLQSSLRAAAPTVVHAHWTYEFALAAIGSGLPTVTTVRDWAPTILRFNPTPYRAVRMAMQAVTFARGPVFTATSPYMQSLLRRWARQDAQVIPNAIDDGAWTEAAQPRHDTPLLLAVNTGFDTRKNVTTLLEAFPRVRARHPDARLRLLGRQHEPGGPSHNWARERGLDDGVEFVGAVPNSRVAEEMHRATVLVHSSLEESFGLVLVEAMARRLPVVGGTRSGAVPWVLDHGHAGTLTDVTSPDRLADAVNGLIASPDRRLMLAEAAWASTYDRFRLSSVVTAYLDLLGACERQAAP